VSQVRLRGYCAAVPGPEPNAWKPCGCTSCTSVTRNEKLCPAPAAASQSQVAAASRFRRNLLTIARSRIRVKQDGVESAGVESRIPSSVRRALPFSSHSGGGHPHAPVRSTLHITSFTLLWHGAGEITARRLRTCTRTLLSACCYLPHSLPASTLQFVDSAFAV
jgi:hypothetical protein